MEGLYKILTKLLAHRIKRVMGHIISQSQSAFIKGRQILDVVLIANKVVDSILRRKESGLVCKLDIEKAYDHQGGVFVPSYGKNEFWQALGELDTVVCVHSFFLSPS